MGKLLAAYSSKLFEIKHALRSNEPVVWPMALYCSNADLNALVSFASKNANLLQEKDKMALGLICRLRGKDGHLEIAAVITEKSPDADLLTGIAELAPSKYSNDIHEIEQFAATGAFSTKTLMELAFVFESHDSAINRILKKTPNIASVLIENPNVTISIETSKLLIAQLTTSLNGKIHNILLLQLNRLLSFNKAFQGSYKDNPREISEALLQLVREARSKSVDRSSFELQSLGKVLVNFCIETASKKINIRPVHDFVVAVLELCIECQYTRWLDIVDDMSRKNMRLPDHINAAYINCTLNGRIPSDKRVEKIIEHAFVSLQTYFECDMAEYLDNIYNYYYESLDSKKLDFNSVKTLIKIYGKNDAKFSLRTKLCFR